MIELAFEGHRWFDLVRTNRLVSLFATLHPEYGITAKHMLFPIPKAQIDLKGSKLKQNPGWD
jgi:starch-binding outer membrane protein, SusD/RagB family